MQDIHTYDFKGKRALIRVDFNVPLDKDTLEVTDNTRIRAAMPTIKHILGKGGSVVIMSHLGRPKDASEPRFSLKNIVSQRAIVSRHNKESCELPFVLRCDCCKK